MEGKTNKEVTGCRYVQCGKSDNIMSRKRNILEEEKLKRTDVLALDTLAVSSSARYIIIDESVSGHCCFGHTVIDTAAGKVSYGDYWKRSMCETFDRAEAEIICDALNKNCC